jgi:hypothetical protein
MTLQDDFVHELQHAAAQVRPVAGLDGAAMAHVAVRRERRRRAALTGVGGLAVVGALAGGWLAARPLATNAPASGGAPEGWTPVSVGGLSLAVPAGLTPSGLGVWGDDQEFVQVEAAVDLPPLAPRGSGLSAVRVHVPGAVSAEYVTEDSSALPANEQDFLGKLQVHLESGEVVQVALVWVDAKEGRAVFSDLVGSVVADDATEALPAPGSTPALSPLDGFTTGVPRGWKGAEFAGLVYALPPAWADDEATAGAYPQGSNVRATSGDGTASLTILQAVDAAGWPESLAPSVLYPAHTIPLDGADVAQVDLRTADGAYTATAHVRREGGRAYIVRIETPDTDEGRALALRLLGTLGLGAEAAGAPSTADLPKLPASHAPADWADAHWGDLRLAVPPTWVSTSTADGAAWASGAGAPAEKLTVTVASDAPPTPYGFRYDVPGAESAVVQTGSRPGDDGVASFLGAVDVRRGDAMLHLEYTGPAGAASKQRFGMLVDSLRLAGS